MADRAPAKRKKKASKKPARREATPPKRRRLLKPRPEASLAIDLTSEEAPEFSKSLEDENVGAPSGPPPEAAASCAAAAAAAAEVSAQLA